MINGKQKASVLPDPVNAIPIKSRPENLDEAVKKNDSKKLVTYAAGIPCN